MIQSFSQLNCDGQPRSLLSLILQSLNLVQNERRKKENWYKIIELRKKKGSPFLVSLRLTIPRPRMLLTQIISQYHGVHCTHWECIFQVPKGWPPTPPRWAARLAMAMAWAAAPPNCALRPRQRLRPLGKEHRRTLPTPPSKAAETIQP